MNFFSAFLNVMAIIAIIAVGAFLVIFISDLAISIVDGKNSMFFGRNKNKTSEEKVETKIVAEEPLLEQQQKENLFLNYKEEPVKEEYKINYEAATKEEEMFLRKRNDIDYFKPAAVRNDMFENDKDEDDYDDYIKQVNSKAVADLEKEKISSIKINDINKQEFNYFNFLDDGTSEPEIVEKLDDEETIEESEQEIDKKKFLETFEEDNLIENNEINLTETEEYKKLQEEIERMKKEIENEKVKLKIAQEEIENEKVKVKTAQEEIENEKIKVKTAHEEIEQLKSQKENVASMPIETIEQLEERLELLQERLKINEKDLKITKKEYIPLKRIKKNLEKDELKLRRKDAIIAKQKIMLFGVNNYVYDEEKEKKLAEELDLLDGLRLSVQHCEEVMNANKDRYPVLEKTYNILTRTNEQLKVDIEDVQNKIKILKDKKD